MEQEEAMVSKLVKNDTTMKLNFEPVDFTGSVKHTPMAEDWLALHAEVERLRSQVKVYHEALEEISAEYCREWINRSKQCRELECEHPRKIARQAIAEEEDGK